jgi:large subunit ribosomal protein L21
MYAVMKTGGKQYRVMPGDVLQVEKLPAEAGARVEFDQVLMLGGDAPQIGAPLVAGAVVEGEIVDQIKGEKVIHFVRRRRKHSSKRRRGHRQQLSVVRITGILADGAVLARAEMAPEAATDTAPEVATDTAPEVAADTAPAPAQTED